MKTVIYHSADFDGIFCREIARKFLGDKDVQYIGWNFGDPPLPDTLLGEGNTTYVLDLPLDRPFGLEFKDGWICKGQEQAQPIDRWDSGNIVWIDHHKSSIETHPKDIPGYRIDGVAACRLAWQWFADDDFRRKHPEKLPSKEAYVDRLVDEPLAVRLAGEYDVWQHDLSGGDDIAFQFGLDSIATPDWHVLLATDPIADAYTMEVVKRGKSAMQCYANRDARAVEHNSWLMDWEGLKFLCLNCGPFNSNTFASKDVPETGHDALLGFRFTGKAWLVSLYHAKHRTDPDLSAIAVKHGGGGHKGACGFTCKTLPFEL